MRKIALALLLGMIAVSVEARDIEPGTVKVSGATNASFINTKVEVKGENYSDTETYRVATDVIYFLTKNIGLGGTMIYESLKTNYSTDVAVTSVDAATIIIGPTVAVEVPINDALNFIADATIGYFQIEGHGTGVAEEDSEGVAYRLSAGVASFPAKQVSLDLTASYQLLDGENPMYHFDNETASAGVNLGVSIYCD